MPVQPSITAEFYASCRACLDFRERHACRALRAWRAARPAAHFSRAEWPNVEEVSCPRHACPNFDNALRLECLSPSHPRPRTQIPSRVGISIACGHVVPGLAYRLRCVFHSANHGAPESYASELRMRENDQDKCQKSENESRRLRQELLRLIVKNERQRRDRSPPKSETLVSRHG